MFKRTELLEKLELVAPALAANEIVPILQHFLFTGTHLLAYNERIAIIVPLKSEFKGAVFGKTLLDQVKMAKHGRDVTIQSEDGRAKVTVGKSTIRVGMMPIEQFTMFNIPAMPHRRSEGALTDNKLFDAIETCLPSVSGYATVPDQLGITVIPERDHIRLYATNIATLSYARLPMQVGVRERTILSADFCREMLRLGKDREHKQLLIRRDHALFVADDIVLHGRLITSANPLPFDETLKRNLPAQFPAAMAKMDSKGKQRNRLKIALQMAAGICDIQGAEVRTHITVSNNTIRMVSQSGRGEVRDNIKLEKHPDADVKVNAALLAGGYDRYEQILLTDKCAIMASGKDRVFMVAYFD